MKSFRSFTSGRRTLSHTGRNLALVGAILGTTLALACTPAASPAAQKPAASGQTGASAQTGTSSQPAAAGQSSARGKELLQQLVEQAKKEGKLDTAITTETGPAVPKMKDAFNKRFGLGLDIQVALGDQAGKFAKLITTLDAGGQPEFDTLTGSEEDIIQMKDKGYNIPIQDWEALLQEMNSLVQSGTVKSTDVSPNPLSGQAFVWSTRTKAFLYNTTLISTDEVPKTTLDMANPKFQGKFVVPPWTDTWELGTLVHTDKAQWLRTLDQIGQNAAGVVNFSPALNRILLGEFSFSFMNTYYYWDVKAKDATAPLGLSWFRDYTPYSKVMYVVPKGSRHPAAATLWALWMTTPEAQEVWQPAAHEENIAFGQSEQDKKARKNLEESGSKVVSWYDSPETIEKLEWWATPEGKDYRAKIKEAITQRQ